jgi:transposase
MSRSSLKAGSEAFFTMKIMGGASRVPASGRDRGRLATVAAPHLVAGAAVKHMDETGFRIGGKTQWLHVACTAWLTFYRVCARRGSLLADVTGIVVHDHWLPYYGMPDVRHALCNAHHLRELKALIEIETEDWARKLHRLLRHACHATNLARERGSPLKSSLIVLIERRYDAFVAAGLAFHEAQSPLRPDAAPQDGVAARRVEPDTIFSCVSPIAGRTSCASSPIRMYPSPTIRPNATCA